MNMKTMMKMMGLTLAFGSMVAFADEPATGDAVSSPRQTQTAATTAPVDAASSPRPAARAARPQLTEEQRKEMKARREKFMAERRAAMEAKMLEVVKKYVPEEDKAKALIKELEQAMMSRPRAPKGRPLPLPQQRPAAK